MLAMSLGSLTAGNSSGGRTACDGNGDGVDESAGACGFAGAASMGTVGSAGLPEAFAFSSAETLSGERQNASSANQIARAERIVMEAPRIRWVAENAVASAQGKGWKRSNDRWGEEGDPTHEPELGQGKHFVPRHACFATRFASHSDDDAARCIVPVARIQHQTLN
jgi:hypothetical protein